MTLPNKINSAIPLGTADPGEFDEDFRALKQFTVDVFGIPDVTDITTAPFNFQATGETRMVQRLEELKGGDIAITSNTITVDTDGNVFDVTGTDTVTSLSSVQAGTVIVLQFDAAFTFTHNGTSLIMRYGVDYTTEAGDYMAFLSLGSGNWKEIFRSQRVGWHLIARSAASSVASVSFTSGIDGTYDLYKLEITRCIPETDGAELELTVTQSATQQQDATGYEHNLSGAESGTAGWSNQSNSVGAALMNIALDIGSGSNEGYTGTVYFSEPDATSTKRFWWKGMREDNTGTPLSGFHSGGGAFNNDTDAIDGIFLEMSAGDFSGELAIYGLVK